MAGFDALRTIPVKNWRPFGVLYLHWMMHGIGYVDSTLPTTAYVNHLEFTKHECNQCVIQVIAGRYRNCEDIL